MSDKLGPYITKLMTTAIDSKEDEFVKSLALTELKRLNIDIEEFIRTHGIESDEADDKTTTKKEKQLLQEEENVKQSSTR